MINIAIVDDEHSEREMLKEYYKRLQSEQQPMLREEMQVCSFASGEALLDGYDFSWDLICLDINMDGADGISIAREIRKLDTQVMIIFVTNMAQMAIQGYEVQALDFLVKPVSYYSFAMKIRSALSMISNKKSRIIVVNTSGGMQKISTDDLYYAEVDGHYMYYHTGHGIYKQKASMKELEGKLTGLSFKRCNNCYLINLKHVDAVSKDDLQIAGEWLKISRPRKKEFLQALANYMGGISI